MAIDLNLPVGNILSTVLYGFVGLIIVSIIVVIIFIFWHFSKFKIKFNVWELKDEQKILINDSAALIKDKDGSEYYKLLKLKDKVYGRCPPEARNITSKGKEVLEAYRLAPGEIIWRTDHIKRIVRVGGQIPNGGTAKETFIDHEFQPITAAQRSVIISQAIIAHSLKKKKAIDFIFPIAGILGIIVLVAVVLVFVGKPIEMLSGLADKVYEHDLQIEQHQQQQHDRMIELISKFDLAMSNTQRIEPGKLGNLSRTS